MNTGHHLRNDCLRYTQVVRRSYTNSALKEVRLKDPSCKSMRMVGRRSKVCLTLLIAAGFTASAILSVISYLDRLIPLTKRQNQAASQEIFSATSNESFSLIAQVPLLITKEEASQHRTYLITRTPCTEKLFVLIMVLTAPAHFDRRNIIRKTWATDPSLKVRWKTMFLLGQAVGDSTEKEYLEAEEVMYRDFIRGAQREGYYNLTLKTEMGLEWAAKYCDFQFLLKADDDVFVNPYRLMDYLKKPDTPETELYLGFVMEDHAPLRGGKYGVSVEEYNKTRYPDFCSGPAYVLSADLVHKLVDVFDVKKPLKLEDVYIATLVEELGVKAVRHHGFHSLQFGPCQHYKDTVVYHRASIQCMEELFNKAMKERVEQEIMKLRTVKTEDRQQSVPANYTNIV